MMGPLVKVGSMVSEDASLATRNLSSPASMDPMFYSPVNAASDREDPASGKQMEKRETPEQPAGKGGSGKVIPVEEILQLRQDMHLAQEASECRQLVDELLRRYGVTQD